MNGNIAEEPVLIDKINDLTYYLLDKKQIELIKQMWLELEKRIDDAGLLCSWDWIGTWLDVYEDTVDFWFIIAIHKEQPVGAVLLTKEKFRKIPVPVKTFHIGTFGEPYKDQVHMINNSFLIINEFKMIFITSLITIIKQKFQWEEIVFDVMNQKDTEIINQVFQNTSLKFSTESIPCPVMDLELIRKNDKDILNSFSNEVRYSIRRSIKAFESSLETEWAESPDKAEEILSELVTYYSKTWDKLGKRNVFSSRLYNTFQQKIIKQLLNKNSVILFRVRSSKYGTLGCLYLLIDNGSAIGYQLGFNDFDTISFDTINKKRLRIGYIVHTLCMEACLLRGLKEYNFSTGIYTYKKDLTNTQTTVTTFSLKNGIKPLLREKIFQVFNTMDENKSTPLIIKMIRKIL